MDLRALKRKLKLRVRDRPNISTTVISTVWSSVPNLPMPTSSGKEQFSAAPPSNEHVIETSGTLEVQKNVCRPATAPIGQVTFSPDMRKYLARGENFVSESLPGGGGGVRAVKWRDMLSDSQFGGI